MHLPSPQFSPGQYEAPCGVRWDLRLLQLMFLLSYHQQSGEVVPRSFMNTKKTVGPRMLSWGTPDKTGSCFDIKPSRKTYNDR